jgi:hypothetical protein
MTPHQPEKEKQTQLITPRLRPRRIQFLRLAAVGAVVQANSTHEEIPFTFRETAVLGAAIPPILPLLDRCNLYDTPRTVSLVLGLVFLR